MAVLVPAIHVFGRLRAWIRGTRPRMTGAGPARARLRWWVTTSVADADLAEVAAFGEGSESLRCVGEAEDPVDHRME